MQGKYEGLDSCHRPNNSNLEIRWDPNQWFPACMTSKLDEWPRKTKKHFFQATSSVVHNFKAISEFKSELQSRNAKFRSKLAISFSPVLPRHFTNDLKKQQGLLLCYLKLRASSCSHQSIQTVVVLKHLFGVKIFVFFCPVRFWNLTDDTEKQRGTCPMLDQAVCII